MCIRDTGTHLIQKRIGRGQQLTPFVFKCSFATGRGIIKDVHSLDFTQRDVHELVKATSVLRGDQLLRLAEARLSYHVLEVSQVQTHTNAVHGNRLHQAPHGIV